MTTQYTRQLILLLVVAGVLLAVGLGLRDPWPADEPRFALIARDMADSGNWLLPYVGGVVYPDKPPLFFWTMAVFYLFTGSLRAAFLLPGMLAGLGTLLLVTDLARRLWDGRTAIWCGATLLALLQFPMQMKSGQIDGLLCLWTTLGLYGLCRHLLLGPDWRWYTIGGIACGLGIITKGVGFLPYLLLIPYALAARRGWPVLSSSWRDPRWLLAPAATLLVVAAWLVPMLLATSGGAPDLVAYRDNILFNQTVTRYTVSLGHVKPPWYLFTNAIPWLWLPVSLLLPWLIRLWRDDLKARKAEILLVGSWILLVLLFFSLSPGKRSLYIFPAAPALALVAGYHGRELLGRRGVQRVLVAVPAVLAALLVAAAVYIVLNPHEADQWTASLPDLLTATVAILVIGLAMLIPVLIFGRHKVLVGFPASMAVFWIGLGVLLAPAINGARSGAGLMQAVDRQVSQELELGFVAWPEQFLLHWNRPATHFGYRRGEGEVADAVAWVSASADRRLLMPDYSLDPCFDQRRVVPVGRAHRRDWVIADRTTVTPACADYTTADPQIVVRYVPPGWEARRATLAAAAGLDDSTSEKARALE